MKAFFTSDTHFGQERTLRLSRRPFNSVDDMDRKMVENWNACVSDDDAVYHLGDFGNPEMVERLNFSRLYLVLGNYDTEDVLSRLETDPRVAVLPYQPFQLMPPWDDGTKDLPLLHLVHEPEKAQNPRDFYLFGHIHQLQMVKRNGLNVGTDCHQFRPLSYSTIVFYYNAIKRHYDHNVFMEYLGKPSIGCANCDYYDDDGCVMLNTPSPWCLDFRLK